MLKQKSASLGTSARSFIPFPCPQVSAFDQPPSLAAAVPYGRPLLSDISNIGLLLIQSLVGLSIYPIANFRMFRILTAITAQAMTLSEHKVVFNADKGRGMKGVFFIDNLLRHFRGSCDSCRSGNHMTVKF